METIPSGVTRQNGEERWEVRDGCAGAGGGGGGDKESEG